MGHIVSDKLVRLDLGGGEWVDLKSQLSVGDYERIATEGKSDKPEGQIIITLVVSIKAWRMKDEAGVEVELTEENIPRLDDKTAVAIFTKIGELNKLSKKARAKPSSSA